MFMGMSAVPQPLCATRAERGLIFAHRGQLCRMTYLRRGRGVRGAAFASTGGLSVRMDGVVSAGGTPPEKNAPTAYDVMATAYIYLATSERP